MLLMTGPSHENTHTGITQMLRYNGVVQRGLNIACGTCNVDDTFVCYCVRYVYSTLFDKYMCILKTTETHRYDVLLKLYPLYELK